MKFMALIIWGLLFGLINFALLSLAVSCHFDTFSDGFVGGRLGGGKIKNKDHLSLADAEVEAEFGKNEKKNLAYTSGPKFCFF